MNRFITRVLLPAIITAASVGGAVVLVRSAESAEREPPPAEAPLVEHIEVRALAARPLLRGTGVVEPAREATISPEVTGRIVHLSPSLAIGGRFQKGDVMVRLDDRALRLAVAQQRSQLQQAKLELELEEGRGTVAEREWALLKEHDTARGAADAGRGRGRLAKREAQHEAAEVVVDAARSALERSKLDLERTVIRAPFNATVMAESVEIGEIAAPGGVIATLVGTDALWVRVSLPVEALALLDIPGQGGEPDQGSKVTVIQRLGGRGTIEREGRVIRLVHQLDVDSRTAQVLVEIGDPFDPPPDQLPLLPGAFVEVQLQGPQLDGVIAVPRVAVFEGRRVWVVDDDDTLHERTLEVAWGDAEQVYVTAGLVDGDHLVVTPPSLAIEGLQVRSEAQAPQVSTVVRESSEG